MSFCISTIMVGILLITHGNLGACLIECATHVMGRRPDHVIALAVRPNDDPGIILEQAKTLVAQLEQGQGILVISDMFGATPSNIARRLLEPGKVEGLAGANLPMLIRALTYRNEPLAQVTEKAISGCIAGALKMEKEAC
jgi:PTS system ascorbate-specific IIA component